MVVHLRIDMPAISQRNDQSGRGEVLKLAIAEYETIARLKKDDIETKLLLGQPKSVSLKFGLAVSCASALAPMPEGLDPSRHPVNSARLPAENRKLAYYMIRTIYLL